MKRLRDVIDIDTMERLLEQQEYHRFSKTLVIRYTPGKPLGAMDGWDVWEVRDGTGGVCLTGMPYTTLAGAMDRASEIIKERKERLNEA
jgi:hypothetical protein